MKWKVTGRYLWSIVWVVILVLFINLFLGLGLLLAQSVLGLPIFQGKEESPEQFTRRFQKEITVANDQVTLTENGRNELTKQKAWIQVLDENGSEIYRFGAPAAIRKKYTPADLIQMYKYKEVNRDTVVYVGEKEADHRRFSYFLGIENPNLNRYVIAYDNRDVIQVFQVGMVILLIDILIALLIGYFFSKKLTQPLHSLIEGIKKLANHEYDFHLEPQGIYKSVFANVNHLSEQLQASQRQREKLDGMKEEWIANISHDMKTPLSSIQGYAEMIKNPDYDFAMEEIREYAGIIETKSLYIKEVIEDLHFATRLKNKEFTLQKKTRNVVVLLRDIVIQILNDPTHESREIQFEANEESIYLEIDELLFRRAIHNLIENAIVHNDSHVQITVSIEKKERTHLFIHDNGKGIRKEELDRIFDRYYRGTNTGAAHKGSGLGMAIARDIIKAHGGEIVISSEIGLGTTIEVRQ